MPVLFNNRQLTTLRAICDTLIPSLPDANDPDGLYARAASDLHIAELIDAALPDVTDLSAQSQFKLFLDALDYAALNRASGSPFRSFIDMSLDERTAALRHWAESRVPMQRQAFQAVKRLAFFLFYSALDDRHHNPGWASFGYAGPPIAVPSTDKPITPLTFTQDVTLDTDVVIIGSGAGGGVVAGELTAVGLNVIVLEKGGYHTESDFDGLELPSNQRLYENKGLCTTADLSMIVLAGSTLGGGTVINWNASFRTPDHVLAEWEQAHGVRGFTGSDYQAALDAVCARINVNENESAPNGQNTLLARGGAALGYAVKVIPRNVKGCEDCGFCTFGCAFGAKQSTLNTYLQDAFDRGARIGVNVTVDRVLIETGQAVGVVGHTVNADGQRVTVTVRARAVVSAAGSLHTPALLLRSGLSNLHIGRNLHLHPTTVTYGLYDEPVYPWQGPPMSRYVSDFTDLDGTGYGFVLETAPVHPGLAALSLSWSEGAGHKRIMSRLDHLSTVIVIARDRGSGQITINKAGRPVIQYSLNATDRGILARGVTEALRIQTAAGAYEISGPQISSRPLAFDPQMPPDTRQQTLRTYLDTIPKRGWDKNSFALFSAHQMSSCRMADSPARGALAPTGESFEVRNLFVADGSALPTAVGRNPMITIMAVSYMTAQHIKSRLQKG